MVDTVKIGVVGYSGRPFNIPLATTKLKAIINSLQQDYKKIAIVSGYTNIGIPKIAYEIANELNIYTVGISAKEALKVDCGVFPVEEEIIVGEQFGEESDYFINYIDVLVRIGGGKQSHHEVDMFKRKYADSDLTNLLYEVDID